MTTSPAATGTNDLIPLGERLRYMRLFRAAVICVVAMVAVLIPDARTTSLASVGLATVVYVAVTALCEGVWRLLRRRALGLFGAMLIVDGLYLAWVSYATGANASPLRYLVLLHLIAVALLASYRTGLKLALWHSMLVFGVHDLQQSGVLRAVGSESSGSEYWRMTLFIVVFWLVTLATTTFSAINERELRRRRFDLEALARMAAELEGATESEAVADVLLDSIVDTFGYERALLMGGPDEDFHLLASRGLPASTGAPRASAAHSVLEQAREGKETMLVSRLDPQADRWLADAFPSSRNLIISPLIAESRVIGVLVTEHAFRTGSRIERRVVSTVERFVSHAALALRNAWLLEQVQKMAATDGLTGISNRRAFDETLEREVARSVRGGEPLSVVLIDIDHFKSLNDTHGHQAGDEVLRTVAQTISVHSREVDTAARYGGEEFAVVLPGCSSYDALTLAERLRLSVADADTLVPVTVSAGVATFPSDASDVATLLRSADEALYESKRAGRNRVTASALRLPDDLGSTDPAAVAG